jgi:hypothetical protein
MPQHQYLPMLGMICGGLADEREYQKDHVIRHVYTYFHRL